MRKVVLSLIVMLAAVFSAKALVYTVVVPEGTKACYIAGTMNSWSHDGKVWDLQLEQDTEDPTVFTIDIPEATAADKYKYCCGPGWGWVEKSAEGKDVGDRTYAEIDYVEAWAMDYDPDAEPLDFTLNVTVPEGTFTVYVKGSWDWNTFIEMDKVDDTHYTVVIENVVADKIQYKYAAGPDWKFVEVQEDGEDLPDNRESSEVVTDDVVARWKEVYDPDSEFEFILNVTVPEGTNAVYVAGSFNGWGFKPMKKVTDITYTVTLNVEGIDEIEYKYLSGQDWKFVEIDGDGNGVDNRILSVADSPSDDEVVAWKEIGDTPTVTLFVTVPEGTNACYVAGSMNGWTPEAMEEMEEVTESGFKSATDKIFTIMLDVVGLEEIEYKYLSGPDWKYEEVISGNRKLVVADSPADDVVAAWKEVYMSLDNVKLNNLIIVGGQAEITVLLNGTATIELYTIQGALIRKAVATGAYNYAGLPSGIYIVKVNDKAVRAIVK